MTTKSNRNATQKDWRYNKRLSEVIFENWLIKNTKRQNPIKASKLKEYTISAQKELEIGKVNLF